MAQSTTLEQRHPDLFLKDKNISRTAGERIVPMSVMNLGFPRCGTMSMQTALNILGFTCYHSICFFSNISDCTQWNKALNAKFLGEGKPFTQKEWDALLGTYSAISADPPAIAFAEDLISLYPDAKVILVSRDIEEWYRSFDDAVIRYVWSKSIWWVGKFDPWLLGPVARCHRLWARLWMRARSKGEMRRVGRGKFVEHYEMVRRVTPTERLLEYELGSGWEPLCEFLGLPVPDVPFPQVNDREHMREHMGIVFKRGIRNGLKKIAVWMVPCAVLILGWWLVARKWGFDVKTREQ